MPSHFTTKPLCPSHQSAGESLVVWSISSISAEPCFRGFFIAPPPCAGGLEWPSSVGLPAAFPPRSSRGVARLPHATFRTRRQRRRADRPASSPSARHQPDDETKDRRLCPRADYRHPPKPAVFSDCNDAGACQVKDE